MNVMNDPLGLLCVFLLAVPATMVVFFLRRALKPGVQPNYRRYFWWGALAPFLLLMSMLPALVPTASLAVVWCLFLIWLGIGWVGWRVFNRLLKLSPQVRKLVTIFVFVSLTVFPLFYIVVLPQMEHEQAMKDAARREKGRIALIERAEKGSAHAQFGLGALYAKGEDTIRQDYAKAAEWYRRAAEQGDAEAQAALARLYADGLGVPQEDTEAYFWLLLASERANEDNKGWIKTLRDKIELYLDRAEIKAVKKRAAEWKPVKKVQR